MNGVPSPTNACLFRIKKVSKNFFEREAGLEPTSKGEAVDSSRISDLTFAEASNLTTMSYFLNHATAYTNFAIHAL